MKKKLIALVIMCSIVPMTLTGCFASWNNQKALKGGHFTTNTATYVVFNESGGTVMDSWILKDAYVESENTSDGVRFVDANGNGVIVQGDAKIVRVNNATDLSKYVEYHYETDLVPYTEFYKAHFNKK